MDAFVNIIRAPFAWIMELFYSWTGSYLVALLVFSVILKLVLFPFSIKQQKNSQKQASLRPKENVIRKKYAGRTDRATQMKMNTEIQELYQKENFSPLGGCLPMILQMVVLLAVYAIVRTPLSYTAPLEKTEVNQIMETVCVMMQEDKDDRKDLVGILKIKEDDVKDQEKVQEALDEALKNNKFQVYAEINVIRYIDENEKAFIKKYASMHKDEKDKALTEKYVQENIVANIPNLELGNGFNLGVIPGFNVIKEKQLGRKLMLLVPVVTLITAYFGQALSRKFTYQPEQAPEMKSQMRIMNVFMPLFSFYIATQVPAALGIYWMMSNILTPVQQIALSKLFPIKEITPEEMKEAERLYGGKQKKKKPSEM